MPNVNTAKLFISLIFVFLNFHTIDYLHYFRESQRVKIIVTTAN